MKNCLWSQIKRDTLFSITILAVLCFWNVVAKENNPNIRDPLSRFGSTPLETAYERVLQNFSDPFWVVDSVNVKPELFQYSKRNRAFRELGTLRDSILNSPQIEEFGKRNAILAAEMREGELALRPITDYQELRQARLRYSELYKDKKGAMQSELNRALTELKPLIDRLRAVVETRGPRIRRLGIIWKSVEWLFAAAFFLLFVFHARNSPARWKALSVSLTWPVLIGIFLSFDMRNALAPTLGYGVHLWMPLWWLALSWFEKGSAAARRFVLSQNISIVLHLIWVFGTGSHWNTERYDLILLPVTFHLWFLISLIIYVVMKRRQRRAGAR